VIIACGVEVACSTPAPARLFVAVDNAATGANPKEAVLERSTPSDELAEVRRSRNAATM